MDVSSEAVILDFRVVNDSYVFNTKDCTSITVNKDCLFGTSILDRIDNKQLILKRKSYKHYIVTY